MQAEPDTAAAGGCRRNGERWRVEGGGASRERVEAVRMTSNRLITINRSSDVLTRYRLPNTVSGQMYNSLHITSNVTRICFIITIIYLIAQRLPLKINQRSQQAE